MTKRATCLVLAILFSGCTTSSTQSDAESAEVESAQAESAEAESTTTSPPSDSTEAATDDPPSSADPLRPYDDAPTTTSDRVDTSTYISRVSMSASSIELTWSTSEGAVEYHLHRLPMTSEEKPDVALMTDSNRFHIADDAGRFIDDGVEAGTRYWYGVRSVDDDGALVAHGWHRADAITDTEPPSQVGALDAVFENGEVLLTWIQPDENYELHGYRVLRGVDGADPEPVSTTWNLEQTSFLDDEPPSKGTVTYAIVAFDFHWNDSAPAEVDVELSE